MSSNINVVKDMIDIRDAMKECASLSMNDINDIIDKLNVCLILIYIFFKVPI